MIEGEIITFISGAFDTDGSVTLGFIESEGDFDGFLVGEEVGLFAGVF